VLLNDDFSSLVTAVRYGRRVFANLRKAIVFVVAVQRGPSSDSPSCRCCLAGRCC